MFFFSNCEKIDVYLHILMFDSGTRNVINACRECRVKRLIYNSSADVVFDGLRDIHDADESLTCPWNVCCVGRTSSMFPITCLCLHAVSI